jgi:hypothetical protein
MFTRRRNYMTASFRAYGLSSTIHLQSRIKGPAREERTSRPPSRHINAQSFLPLTRPSYSDFGQRSRESTSYWYFQKTHLHTESTKPRQSTKVLKFLRSAYDRKSSKVDHVSHYYRIIHFVQFVRSGYHSGPENAIYPHEMVINLGICFLKNHKVTVQPYPNYRMQ